MEKKSHFIFQCILFLVFSFIFVLTSSCKSSTQSEPLNVEQTGVNTGGLSLVSNALPAWKAGQFGTVQLRATGGTAPYKWSLKKGSEMPYDFILTSDGVISGTAPLLPSDTPESISPPFTVVVTDSDGQQKEVQLNITILQPEIDSNTEEPNQVSEPASSIDTLTAKLTRSEGNEYYFDIEATGTATAPVGYEISIKLDGHSPDEQTSSWTQDGTIEFAKLVFRRDAGQPESITWKAVWHNYMVNQGQFDLQLNEATVQIELIDDENLYVDSQETSLRIQHP
jgi:hypothetical protein